MIQVETVVLEDGRRIDCIRDVNGVRRELERLEKRILELERDANKEPAWLNEALNSGDGSYRP